MSSRFSGLWQQPEFMKLWIGQTISEFGSRITRDAIPLVAVITLAATPAQMGVLTAIGSLPILFLSLIAGVWIDRLRRRPIMIVADLGRAIILLTIPLAALSGHLTIGLLYGVVALMSIFSLLFDLAYRSILPSLVAREQLLEGNSKLATTESLAEIGGPALAGLLIQWISAPLAIFFDAISFLFSGISVALIRKPEGVPEATRAQGSVWRDVLEGLHVIGRDPVLRTLIVGMGLQSFFGNFIGTLYAFYAVRDLGLTPGVLGILIAAGGVGALVGTLLAQWGPSRFGLGRTLTGSLLVGSIVNLLIPLASGPTIVAAALLITVQLINDGAMAVYLINEISLRQLRVPGRLLGRTNASMGFLSQGIAPLGALVAGALATCIGTRPTLWLAVLGILVTSVWMVFSPVRRIQAYSEPVT
jgi:MFS family permease